MKQNKMPRTALFYLIIGLLMVSLTPIISRYFPVPETVKGFLTGMGLMFEVIALIKMQRSKRNKRVC